MFARSLALVAALGLIAAPAVSQDSAPPERPSLWDVLSVESLTTSVAHALMGSARFLADIRYDRISVDPMAARIDFVGLRIEPLFPDASGICRIDAAQATLRGSALDRIDQGRFSLVLDDLTVSNGCLPEEVAPLARGLGHDRITARRIEADLNYDYASGGADLRISADFDRLAALQLHADLDYISYRMNAYTQEPMFAVDLNSAQLSVTDLGAWAIAHNFLPPDMKSPEGLSQAATQGLQMILEEMNGLAAPDLSDDQRAFVADVGAHVADFGTKPLRLVLATNIATPPLRLDDVRMARFRPLFDALSPSIGTSAPMLAQAIPVARLQAILTTAAPPEDTLAAGRALISGIGAPRNISEGLLLLEPLAKAGNAQAAAEIAKALADSRPAVAYDHALHASAAGFAGTLAVLNRIERDLPFQAMMNAQDAALTDATPDPAIYGDARTLRDTMRGYFTGTDRPRSYAAAYYWALISAASGDASGAALRGDIAEMMRLRGDAERWQEVAARLEDIALRDWLANDVPKALRGTP